MDKQTATTIHVQVATPEITTLTIYLFISKCLSTYLRTFFKRMTFFFFSWFSKQFTQNIINLFEVRSYYLSALLYKSFQFEWKLDSFFLICWLEEGMKNSTIGQESERIEWNLGITYFLWFWRRGSKFIEIVEIWLKYVSLP